MTATVVHPILERVVLMKGSLRVWTPVAARTSVLSNNKLILDNIVHTFCTYCGVLNISIIILIIYKQAHAHTD